MLVSSITTTINRLQDSQAVFQSFELRMLYWAIGSLILIAIAAWWLIPRRKAQRDEYEAFAYHEEELRTLFLSLARQRGKPRGLRWTNCDWPPEVVFAREQETGLLTALAAVNISFEAIEGEDMEDVEAVGLLREASAVFHFKDGRWGTGGRALFNMPPAEAIQRLEGQFTPVERTVNSTDSSIDA